MRALPFAEDELVLDVESRGERKHLSRQEKRRQKMTVEAGQEKREWSQPSMALELDIPTNIVELQRQDKTLELWFQKATGGVKGTQNTSSVMQEEQYILKNDILYQVKGECENLVVPSTIRERVMYPSLSLHVQSVSLPQGEQSHGHTYILCQSLTHRLHALGWI